jgi:CHAT domain-containing protein
VCAACEAGPERRSEPSDARPAPEERVTEADSLYHAGEFLAARRIWEAQLADAWSRDDSVRAARLLTSLGLAARHLGAYEESRKIGLQALELKLGLGMEEDLFRSYNALGLLAWTQGDLDEAAGMFERAASAASEAGDELGVAKAMGNMAHVRNDRGEPYEARNGFEALQRASRAAGDSVTLGRTLINMAMLDIRLGDPLSAVALLEEARALSQASGDAEAEENALGQLATALSAMGQPQRALAVLDTAANLAEAHGLRRQVAENWKLVGDLFADAGDHRRALEYYARAQVLNAELGLVEESGNAGAQEARSYLALGHADSAHSRARQALELHRAAGYRAAELDDRLLLAETLFEPGMTDDAVAMLDQAGAIAADMNTAAGRARVALVSARLRDRAGRSREVLGALDIASVDLVRLAESERWEPDALRARAYARLGRLTAAEAAGRSSIAAIERFRGGYADGVLRTTFLSARAEVYSDLVVVLIRQGRVEEAFQVADAARGRALLDHLAAARSDIERLPRSASELLELDRLLREIDALANELSALDGAPPDERGAPHEETSRSLESRLAAARQRYEDRLAVVARSNDLSLIAPSTVSASAVRAALRPGEAILEYLASPSDLHVFVLDPDGVRYTSIAVSREVLASRVRLARELVARPGGDPAFVPVLRALHRDLLEKVLQAGALEGVRRLLIVPHGPLVYLPFSALIDEAGGFTLTRFEIAILPAAAALPALRGGKAANPSRAPVGGLVLAPMPHVLPATRAEAASVQRAVRGIALFGNGASERAARQGLASEPVVHIATHGSMNPDNPMFSRIELAPGAGGPDDDGRLEVHELLGLRVASGLVFLSGCETGMGDSWTTMFDRADDYATLAQAILYAGAQNVVATLWRVNDEAAGALAEKFYEEMRERRDPVAALAGAQRALLSDPRFAAPYYWASYEVLGAGAGRE